MVRKLDAACVEMALVAVQEALGACGSSETNPKSRLIPALIERLREQWAVGEDGMQVIRESVMEDTIRKHQSGEIGNNELYSLFRQCVASYVVTED